MELCDSHCHIQSIGSVNGDKTVVDKWTKAGISDPKSVIDRAHQASVNRLICVGCNLTDSQIAVDFVSSKEGCWASVGIHPHEASHNVKAANTKYALEALVKKPKVVAIGECGLDFFYTHSPKTDQKAMLRLQIELALQHNLPLIFHVREAYDDFWPIFESYTSQDQPIRGVLHSFTDTKSNLDYAIKHGLYIGVNGIATFTKDLDQREIYRTIPLENLLLETDAPFLTPLPFRGNICEPYHIQTIAEHLAALRNVPIATIASESTRNARQLFGI